MGWRYLCYLWEIQDHDTVGEVPELAISCSEIIGKDGVKTMNEKKKELKKVTSVKEEVRSLTNNAES